MIDEWINTVQCGDCVSLMHKLPPNSIDLIVTDPPAEAGPRWLDEAFNVLKAGSVCYVLSTEATIQKFKSFVDSSGFSYIKTITWNHPNAPVYKWTPIFILSLGEPEVELPKKDVWNYEVVPMNERFIPSQKPLKLFEDIILLSSSPGEIVLDPFLGSGTTAVACKRFSRRWIGIELMEERCRYVRNRLAKVIP
jgi:DNA modification methylase